MLFESLILSAFLLLIVNGVAFANGGYRGPCIAAALSVGLVGALASVAIMLNALLIVMAGAICLAVAAHPRTFLLSSLGVTALAYIIVGLYNIPKVTEKAVLAAQFPFESMSLRLAYENKSKPADYTSAPGLNVPKASSPATENDKSNRLDHLKLMEDRIDSDYKVSYRAAYLKDLHAGFVTQFVNAPGFGVGRRIRPSDRAIQIENPKPIPVSDYDYSDKPVADSRTESSGPQEKGVAGPLDVDEAKLGDLHANGLFDFINPRGFGYIQSRDLVAGFQTHRFSTMPKLEAPLRWIIQDLELVSLLKHDEPVAYVSKHLPRMDELREAKTRPLDAFERDALEVLRRGEDLKVQNAPRDIRMLGSIRAVKQCLQCHEVERGDLLGAFSYRLRPE